MENRPDIMSFFEDRPEIILSLENHPLNWKIL